MVDTAGSVHTRMCEFFFSVFRARLVRDLQNDLRVFQPLDLTAIYVFPTRACSNIIVFEKHSSVADHTPTALCVFVTISAAVNTVLFLRLALAGVYSQRIDVQSVGAALDILSNSRRHVQQVPLGARQDIGRRTRRDAGRTYTARLCC